MASENLELFANYFTNASVNVYDDSDYQILNTWIKINDSALSDDCYVTVSKDTYDTTGTTWVFNPVEVADTVIRVKNGGIESVTKNENPKKIDEVKW